MKNILVTGGAGYIGSHVCKALAAAGFNPVSYDNLSRGHRYLVNWGPLEVGDLSDIVRLEEVFEQYAPKGVVHLAAFAYIAESIEKPDMYHRNNVENARILLDTMERFDVGHLVFSSSCASYGVAESIPISENAPQKPINPYGQTKLDVEQEIINRASSGNLSWMILRYFNAAGADPDGECGEDHDPEPHLIPRALMAANGDLPAFDILGTDYPTEDGTAVRDFVHVSDLAAAHVQALWHLLDGGPSRAFNIGSDQGYSVRNIISSVERITGNRIHLNETDRRPGDPPILVANSTLIRQELGYSAMYTDIDDIIESAWRWFCYLRQRDGKAEAGSGEGLK